MLAWGFIMSLGYAAETFSFGEAFLKSDRVRDTACLLTDVQMPGVNGLELQRRLTEQGYPLPIIFIRHSRAQKSARKRWRPERLVFCFGQAVQ